jgi:cell wall-associated NlpC family hydrolase
MVVGAIVALVVAAALVAVLASHSGSTGTRRVAATTPASGSASRHPGASRRVAPAATAAASGQIAANAPLPKSHPRVVDPTAGEAAGGGSAASSSGVAAESRSDMTLPKPTGPATVSTRDTAGSDGLHGLQANKATALPNGVALPPLQAPEAVMEIIRAGNQIARTPYIWGGGHGRFLDKGYDCSGSVSFVLYSAGLIGGPETSGQLESWGRPGPGRWVTVYANAGHTFMQVAGVRFDTVGQKVTGSRWQNQTYRSVAGFVARHPPGL